MVNKLKKLDQYGTESKIGPSGADFTIDSTSTTKKENNPMKEWSKKRGTETIVTEKDKP